MPDTAESGAPQKRRIVAVYENTAAREYALRFFDDLTERQPTAADLDILWCAFTVLRDPAVGNDAVDRAATADMILFSMSSAGDLPHEVKLWIERWLNRRSEREGALIGLVTDRPANPFEIASLKEVYLRHTAHRAKMDYLSHELPTARKAIPDSIDSFNRRAGQMTSVLDQILRNQPTPSIPIL